MGRGEDVGDDDNGIDELVLDAPSVEDRGDDEEESNGTQSGGMRMVPVESGWMVAWSP